MRHTLRIYISISTYVYCQSAINRWDSSSGFDEVAIGEHLLETGGVGPEREELVDYKEPVCSGNE